MTFRSAILDKRVRISSWMPSAKYALALSSLRFSKGKTAIDFSGIAAGLASEDPRLGEGTRQRRKIEKLTARTAANKSKAITSTDFGQRAALIGRIGAPACFHLFPRLSLSGRAGLPRPSLQRFTT